VPLLLVTDGARRSRSPRETVASAPERYVLLQQFKNPVIQEAATGPKFAILKRALSIFRVRSRLRRYDHKDCICRWSNRKILTHPIQSAR
jgi:hypothetical protein